MSNVDRRQFYIAKDPLVRDDFKTLALSCGLILSYHHELKVAVDGDNVLLGYAFSCTKERVDVANGVNEMHEWSGRWVLITKEALYLDACGTLGVFYGRDDGGNIVLSSSLHLISSSLKKEWIADYEVKRGDFVVFDFYPIPHTPYKDIKAILPTQYITLSGGTVQSRTDYNFKKYEHLDPKEIQDKFIECFTRVLRNINREFGDEVWIPMTGGVDSRTIFAVSQKAEIPFQTYTLIRDDLKPWDRKIPFKISKKTKISHRLIDSRCDLNDHQDRMNDVLIHCGGKVTAGTEIIQYLSGADVPVHKMAIVLWGTTFPICACGYRAFFPELDSTDDILKMYEEKCGGVINKSNIHRFSLKEWLVHSFAHPIQSVDWRMRQYWEQRNGAWQMYAHQMLDMLDSVRVAPINSMQLIELLCTGNSCDLIDDFANGKKFQKSIISISCKKIAKIHYGEPTHFFYRLCRKLKRIVHLT